MTDTIDVAALVERLTAGKAETTGHEVVWVQNMRAFIDSDMFRTFPEWRKIFREEFDNLLAASAEAATALQSQADALAEAGRLVSESEAQRYRSCGELLTRTTTAEASLATMREALEEAELQIKHLHEKLGKETASGNSVLAMIRRALGGSNAE